MALTLASLRDYLSSSTGRIKIMAATRGFLATGVPFLVLDAVGFQAATIFTLLGGLNTAIADAGGEYRSRLFGMSLVLFVMPLVLFCGMQIHEAWLQALMLCVVAILGGFARALGATGTSIGLVGGIVFLVGIQLPAEPAEAMTRALFYAGGSAWAIAVSLVVWWLRPYRRIRQEVAGCLEATAHLLDVSSRRRSGEPRDRDRDRIVAAEHQKVRQTIEQARLVIGELSTTGANDKVVADLIIVLRATSRIASLGISLREIRITGPKLDEAALAWLDDALKRVAAACRALAQELLGVHQATTLPVPFEDEARSYRPQDGSPTSEHLRQLLDMPDRMRVHLGDALEALDRLTDGRPRGPHLLPTRNPAQILRSAGRTLQAHLSTQSLILRHALRVGVATGAGIIIAHRLGLPHPIWIPLTTLVVLQPNFGGTWSRSVGRTVGTIAGAALASGLLLALPGPLAITIAIALLTFITFLFFPKQYQLAVTCLTALIILMLSRITAGEWSNVIGRVVDTLIGTSIALAVGFALWPIWERHQMPEQLARAMWRLRDYAAALFGLLVAGKAPDGPTPVDLKRLVEIEIANTDAMFQRMRLEPRASRPQRYRSFALLTQIQRLHRHLTALAATLEIDPQPHPAFTPLAASIPEAITALAQAAEKDQVPSEEEMQAIMAGSLIERTDEERTAPMSRLVDRILSDVDSLRTIGR